MGGKPFLSMRVLEAAEIINAAIHGHWATFNPSSSIMLTIKKVHQRSPGDRDLHWSSASGLVPWAYPRDLYRSHP